MTLKHLRSSTADKRPQPSGMADGQLAINTASGSPGLFFKDTNGSLVKVGPVHVGSGAPNVSPASGGTTGNSLGEQWLDTSNGNYVFKIWDGGAWRSETGEFVNASGDTMTGSLVLGSGASLVFEGSTDDGFETTLTVVDPTADRTITLPNVNGTVVTTGDTGTVTSTMLLDGTIVNADVNASAAIAGTKISPDFGGQTITTSGIVSVASGSPAAPSIAINGDANTGIYSPGADQVAISTNGAGRLFVDASGNVGIGSTPSVRLDVRQNQAAYSYFDFYNTTAGGGIVWRQIVRNLADTGTTSIDFVKYLSGGFAIANNDANAANFTAFNVGASERLRITSAGLVGIGTSTPNSSLHILGGSANIGLYNGATDNGADRGLTITTNRTSTSGEVRPFLEFFSARSYASSVVGQGRFYYNWSTGLVFENGTASIASNSITPGAYTERFCISPAGNIGIGTSSPSAVLYVNNASGVDPSLTYGATAGQTFKNGTTELAFGAATSAPFAHWIQARFSTNAAQPLLLNPLGGNVGIGTTSPGGELHIAGSDANTDIFITEGSTNTDARIRNSNGVLLLDADVNNENGSSAIVLGVDGTERARIDSSGRLLVGTSTAPSYFTGSPGFSVNGTGNDSFIAAARYNSANAFGSDIAFLRSRSGTVGTQTIVQSGDALGALSYLGSDGTSFIPGARIIGEVDGTPGANDMPGRLVFSTTADGASSPTERMRIDNKGGVGIGGTAGSSTTLRLVKNITGSTTAFALNADGQIQSDVTSDVSYFRTSANTADAAFSLASLIHYQAAQGTITGGTRTAPTNQYGFWVRSSLTGATNNYGFYSDIASGTGRWNFYANGTADNYFAGNNFIFANGGTERARIDSSGRLLVGTSTDFKSTLFQVRGSATIGYAANDAFSEALFFTKTRATSPATQTVVQDGDALGLTIFQGSDGSAYRTAAQIGAFVDGTPGANDMPGRLVFSTTADGASSPTEAMRIGSNGSVTMSAGRLGVGDFYIFTASGGLNNGQSLAVTFGSASATHRGQNIFRITYCVHTNNSATLYAASFIVNIKDSVTTGYSLSLTDFQSLYNVGATIGSTADLTFVDNADGTASITFPNKVGASGNSSNTTAKVTVERICSGFNSTMIPTAATVV